MSFNRVLALRPPRSVFNLSYEKKFDFSIGSLVPICCEEMVPGDTFKVGNEIVCRFHALNAPLLHEVNVYVHYFFCPTRLLFDGWEDFISGGIDGNDTTVLPRLTESEDYTEEEICGPFSLYDYFGFPILKDSSDKWSFPGKGTSVELNGDEYFYRPLVFPWRAYNLCYNEYYRDETLQEEVDLDQPLVLNRNWSKDFFTSALPWQQRGTAPALPVDVSFNFDGTSYGYFYNSDVASKLSSSGSLPIYVDPNSVSSSDYQVYSSVVSQESPVYTGPAGGTAQHKHFNAFADASSGSISGSESSSVYMVGDTFNKRWSDAVSATSVDVSELRLVFQLQKWKERNARCGVRYTEFLHAHYGVSPRDDRLQRPEYLGGSKSPIIISEVLQTSSTASQPSPLGRMAGKGITADKNYCFSYSAKEFGYLIGIMSVLPKPSYQQGVDAQWLRASRYDFFSPEFSHLSEQKVSEEQLYAFPGVEKEGQVGNGWKFGYQARFNEMRSNQNKVCGSLRDTLDYWHLGRKFDSAPQLNSDFITCDHERDDLDRIFAVQSVPGIICNFANIITAIRPIPKYGEPGLVDHY